MVQIHHMLNVNAIVQNTATKPSANISLLESADVVGNMEVTSGLRSEFIHGEAFSHIDQVKLAGITVDVEHSEIGNNHADSAGTGERERTLLNNLGLAVF